MEFTAAQRCKHHFHNNVFGVLDLGDGSIFQSHLVGAVKYHSLHSFWRHTDPEIEGSRMMVWAKYTQIYTDLMIHRKKSKNNE